ncbi:60S ribosomal protein L20 [Sporothrix schenckii 1099-18]|nr:60S ribosomal protein L20 [Sporothrix schenckii 1099-18]KJR89106.1 60S ribosomal protein L20 [Sporothrix schenckii 1099-18]
MASMTPIISSSGAAASSARRLWASATTTCSLLQSTTSTSSASPLIPSHSQRLADRRHQSTANRTKRALNIAPHASFLTRGGGRDKAGAGSSSGAASEVATALGTIESKSAAGSTTTLLYNPPASAPSVYQTPFKFLPKSDPRRRSNLTNLFARTSSTTASTSSAPTPRAPALAHRNFAPAPQQYHLTPEDVDEIRRLRAQDPLEWSVHRLAHKFQCSPIFVMMVVRSSAEHRAAKQQQAAAARARWGPIRTKARAERVKRREMLFNGEL